MNRLARAAAHESAPGRCHGYLGVAALLLAACVVETPRAIGPIPDTLPDTMLPAPGVPQGPPRPGSVPAFYDGVVTTSEPLAAQAGARVLAEGGNAVDAAAAVLFMLNVVEPQSSGIGGGGFMLIHMAGANETVVLDYRERAPAAASPDMYLGQSDYSLRASSGYTVGVPGAVRGVATALERWGTLTLAEVLQPAIEAAGQGIPVSARLAGDSASSGLDHELSPADDPLEKSAYDGARAVFRANGNFLKAGDRLLQPDLLKTFEQLAESGPDAFYDCDHESGIARAIVDTQHITRRSNPDGEGRMTCADLRSYTVEIVAPISRRYRGYDIVTIPPPSSGGIGLLQMLRMLERFPLGDQFAGFGSGQFFTLNATLEAMRLTYADRALWAGDQSCPGCRRVPVQGLIADAYLAARSRLIKTGKRMNKVKAGDPRPFDPKFSALNLPAAVQRAAEGTGNTTHFTIIDAAGDIVSCTTSIGDMWGTGLMVPGHGFLLNDELTDFNPEPRLADDPDRYDPGANDVAPLKRPRSSMAPVLVFLGGEPVAAYGSPGGASIINTVLNVTLALVDHRKTLQQSVIAPRISLTSAHNAERAEVEPGFNADVRQQLRDLDYKLSDVPALGAVQAIVTIPQSGEQYGAADPRSGGGVAAADP